MSTDLDAHRKRSLESWNEMARGWEARDRWMNEAAAPVSEWILAHADLQPDQTVLEVASGPGDLGRRAAHLVGDGQVLSTDFAAEMVAAAQRIGASGGPANVEYRVLDAERMDLPDDSADAVLCRWGYMLMANPAVALGETRRVLRDGGPLALAVWAGPESNPWAALPGRTLVERGHLPAPEPGAPSVFALADPERIRALLADAGFAEVTVEEIPFEFRHPSSDDLWGMQVEMSARLASALNGLAEGERAATRAAVEAGLANFRRADGSYALPALCLAALAR